MRVSTGPRLELLLSTEPADTYLIDMPYQEQEWEVAEAIRPAGYEFITPEELGALTDAPIITDGNRVWWFPDYQVQSPWDTLAREGKVVFQYGGSKSCEIVPCSRCSCWP